MPRPLKKHPRSTDDLHLSAASVLASKVDAGSQFLLLSLIGLVSVVTLKGLLQSSIPSAGLAFGLAAYGTACAIAFVALRRMYTPPIPRLWQCRHALSPGVRVHSDD